MALQPARERKAAVSASPRRLRDYPGRGAEERRHARSVRSASRLDAGIERDRRRQSARRQARARRIRTRRRERAGRAARSGERSVSDHAQRARRRLPDGAPPPLGALAAPGRRSCACAHEIIKAARDFFDERGFTLTDPPIFTPAACEGTTTLFPVDYFDEQAYLTQSGQLYIEATRWRSARSTPSARRSAPRNRRRAATSPSSGWSSPKSPTPTLDDVMELAEGFISFIVKRCSSAAQRELQTIGRDISKLEKIEKPFPRITYDEAVKMLQEGHSKGALEKRSNGAATSARPTRRSLGAVRPAGDGPSLSREGEGVLHGARSERPEVALGVDVLAPEGLRRDHRRLAAHGRLRTAAAAHQEHGLPQEAFKWYLDLRKYGSVPHGGFGMGIERASPGSAASSTCARRFRFRECCTGCTL
jgi:hypothetical protein